MALKSLETPCPYSCRLRFCRTRPDPRCACLRRVRPGAEPRHRGRYAQPPSLLGWAITTHHSQGMTLPDLHLDPAGIFAPGQLNVGLSRAPSLTGLSHAAPVNADHVLHDRRVRQYQSQLFDKMDSLTDEVPVPA